MNLTEIFEPDSAIKQSSLVDHSWLEKPESVIDVDAIRKPNNIKPNLEVEWGGDPGEISLNEPAGVVQRNLPVDSENDSHGVIVFARDMMNRGFRSSQIVAEIKSKYPQRTINASRKELTNLFAMDGLIGRVMIDARGYKNCKEAIKTASKSPYKRFIKFVYGCKCGSPHMVNSSENMIVGSSGESCGNGIDDFIGGGSAKNSAVKVAHCQSTMLRIIAGHGDLDDSFMDSTMIEMMNVTGIPKEAVEKIRSMKGSSLGKIRRAFRCLDEHIEASEKKDYRTPVNASEFMMNVVDNELDIDGAPIESLENIDPSLGEIEIETPDFEPQDVDLSEDPTSEFEGYNEVELDDPIEVVSSLDISVKQDFTF